MAITIINSPASDWMSAYNPIKWKLDSTNKNTLAFRYIVEVYDAGTSNKLIEQDIAPDPTDSGYCNVDISRIVRNKVDKFLDINTDTIQNAVGTNYRYDIKFGESYVANWAYNDYVFITGGVALTTDTTYGASFSNATHSFVVGDQVKVQMNTIYNDCRDVINGFFTIVSVPSNKTILINLPFPCSGGVSPGIVRYSDMRKVRNYNLTSQTNRGIVNTAMNIVEYSSTLGSLNSYEILSSTSSKFLTNAPNGFKVSPYQHLWINMFEKASNNGTNIRIQNSNGDTFNIPNSGDFIVKQNGVGPANFGTYSVATGTGPIIKSDTEWYDIWVINGSASQISEKKRFVLDRKCSINDCEIVFMDRKGSFMSFYFPLKIKENLTYKKDMFNKQVDTYTTYADGKQVYNSEFSRSLNLTTGYLTDDMNRYFEEILTSPYTYIRWEDVWYACKVKDGSSETERARNKRLLKRNIDVDFDINNPINI
jgi:hypothetical protein